jgi:2-polyprenyl-3-methyl-5-hydroxy-6-metoxy-1,4-benzoquinol methylase
VVTLLSLSRKEKVNYQKNMKYLHKLMVDGMIINETNNHHEILNLNEKMNEFYQNTNTYTAFISPSNHERQWREIIREARKRFSNTSIRILEVGAGKSGFKKFSIENNFNNFEFVCQDITDKNTDYLIQNADEAFIGDLNDIAGKFHIIFHSYVFEHISCPRAFLDKIDSLLLPGGFHCIECPKYDFWFYTPNSLDHIPPIKIILFRLQQLFRHRPFSIISDPAIFHLPFYLDRDAVHFVNEKDIRQYYKHSHVIRSWSEKTHGIKNWIIKNFCTCRLIISQK